MRTIVCCGGVSEKAHGWTFARHPAQDDHDVRCEPRLVAIYSHPQSFRPSTMQSVPTMSLWARRGPRSVAAVDVMTARPGSSDVRSRRNPIVLRSSTLSGTRIGRFHANSKFQRNQLGCNLLHALNCRGSGPRRAFIGGGACTLTGKLIWGQHAAKAGQAELLPYR